MSRPGTRRSPGSVAVVVGLGAMVVVTTAPGSGLGPVDTTAWSGSVSLGTAMAAMSATAAAAPPPTKRGRRGRARTRLPTFPAKSPDGVMSPATSRSACRSVSSNGSISAHHHLRGHRAGVPGRAGSGTSGRKRATQRFGRLGFGEIGVVAEDDGSPLARRQLLERGEDRLPVGRLLFERAGAHRAR